MKIAIVIEKYDPSGGGNERSTEQIARRLIARGHGVTILTSRRSGDALEGGRIEVPPFRARTATALGLMRFANWAQRTLESGGFDVGLSMTTAVAADVIQPRGGTVRETLERNIVMRSNELKRKLKFLSTALSPKRMTLLTREARVLRDPRVKKIIAISRYVADQLFHHYALSKRIVEEIPNAAEVTPFNPVDRQVTRTRMRRSLRLGDGDVAFLFAARNLALKGLPQLLAAMRGVIRREPRVKLIVAGVLDYPAMKPIDRGGFEESVRWVGPTREMDALYAAADVTILPTWYDPSSKVILESLLHGVPAISTLYNGASQWILSPTGRVTIRSPFESRLADRLEGDPQPAGRVIVSPRDIGTMSEAMLDLCDEAERERCSMATVGLARHITMERHVERLETLLQSVATRRQTTAAT